MADTNELSPTAAIEASAVLAPADPTAASSLTLSASAPGTGTATPNPGTGTVTPFVELDENGRRLSLNVSLADLCAKAARLYTMKSYEEAAELYAQAAEFQAEMNGEMSPDNAEILFLYGRTLFRLGQSKSDVLGGKAPAAGEEGAKKSKKAKTAAAAAKPAGEGASVEKAIEEKVATTVAEEATEAKKTEEPAEKKPLFQFTGDENFDESDEEVGHIRDSGNGPLTDWSYL